MTYLPACQADTSASEQASRLKRVSGHIWQQQTSSVAAGSGPAHKLLGARALAELLHALACSTLPASQSLA